MKWTYPEHAEELIRTYVPDTEELALCGFGGLYAIACERDEEAAAQLEMDCADLPVPMPFQEAVPA